MRFSAPHTLITVPQGTVGVRSTGTGPDLVFIHGWPTNSTTWNRVVDALSDRYTVHVIDLPGSGVASLSGIPKLGFRDHAAAVIAVLDALSLRSAVLVGHDSGGAIARFVAAQWPERVSGLIIGGTEIPNLRPLLILQLKLVSWLPGASWLFRFVLANPWLLRSRLVGFGSVFSDPAWTDKDFFSETVAPIIASSERVSWSLEFLRQFDFGAVDELAQIHQRLTLPILMIWGEHDGVFPLQEARKMQGQFAGEVTLKVIAKGRLFAHEDFAEEYAKYASDWLVEQSGMSGSPSEASAT